MNIAFSTLACPDWSWTDIIANGTRFGYHGVEVRLLQRETDLLKRPEFHHNQRATRRRELADAGFRISGLASSVHFDDPEPQQRKQQLDIGKEYLHLAAELEAGFVRVFGDVVPEEERLRDETVRHIAEGLQQLGETAESLGVQVVLETHGDFADSALMEQTMSQVASPAVGVLWDTHHPWRFCGEALPDTFTHLRRWIRHVHWKDSISTSRAATSPKPPETATQEAAEQAHTLMRGHRHADYVLFGGGEFPIADCLRLLLDAEFTGWHCYEWEKAWHPEIEDPEIALWLFPQKMHHVTELLTH